MMALVINVVLHVTTSQNLLANIIASAVMFVSYFFSDDLSNFALDTDFYLVWLGFDITTMLAVLFAVRVFQQPITLAVKYLCVGLMTNGCLCLAMYADIGLRQNTEPWLLWDIYSIGGTFIDFAMIAVLILNRDFLGIFKLKKRIWRTS
ncbi:hypothetical protein ACFOEE_17980 [Pseudoalteromonas fenneropenaei]|uniref:Uncharacterized protein n=1 Tax=Pseudoalteromonas fenneropenaei TaxID=1737459 RepID=A0ABV7CP10_9GAMM